jgi:hypothetical protein
MGVDRKSLIRQYKDTPRTMGVGIVRNLVTGKALVVAGVDLPSLLNRHRAQLRFNSHAVAALQADWNAQGSEAFAFEVLDTIEPGEEPGYAGSTSAADCSPQARTGSASPATSSPAPADRTSDRSPCGV